MIPLVVTADMAGAVEWRSPVMLDGLLASVVAQERGLSPPRCAAECVPIDIPIALEPRGRFHLCSEASCSEQLFARTEYIHKRPPVAEMAFLGPSKFTRINIKAGEDKGWRVPCPGEFYQRLTWHCVGDPDRILDLLGHVTALGGRRRHGVGHVRSWHVDPCELVDGALCLIDGRPMRALPLDWPGVDPESRRALRNLTFPYYLRETQELLWVP